LITTQWGDIDGSISAQADLQNVLNAKADLVSGKVPASQLPSYVDDVLEFANLAALPTTGETGKIYITLDTNKIYRWSGSTYIEITQGGVWGTITGTLSNQSDLQTALNNKQNASPDLSSIAGLTGTTGLLRKTAANTYSLDTNSYLPLSGGTLASSGSTNTLNINHSSGSGVATSITKGGNGEALTVVKSSGSGNAASITGGVTLLSELNLTTKLADAHINSAAVWNAKQNALNGTGFVKISGTTISYDNSSYALASSLSGYLPLSGGTLTGALNGTSATFSGNVIAQADIRLGTDLEGPNTGIVKWQGSSAIVPNSIGIFTWAEAKDIQIGGRDVYFQTEAGSNRMVIKSGGNVGIGTTTDAGYKLDVNGTGRFSGDLTGTSATFSGAITGLNGGIDATLGDVMYFGNKDYQNAQKHRIRSSISAINTDNLLVFETSNGTIGSYNTNQLVFKGDGNVGIGTNAPAQKLDVNGLINSTNGISVGGSGVSVAWTGTQAQYDAIATKSSTTIYFIQ